MSSLQQSIRRIRPAIVQIVVSANLPEGETLEAAVAGTGFFVAEEQYVATAAHVFTETQAGLQKRGAREVQFHVNILLSDVDAEVTVREGFLGAPFEFVEVDLEHDLALLKTRRPVGRKGVRLALEIGVEGKKKTFEVAHVGNVALHTGGFHEGEPIAVSGFPLQAPYLVTQQGIVSAMPILPVLGTPKEREEVVVDIMVNPGNSGGPVFLARNAKVIGVCRAHRVSPIITKEHEPTALVQHAGLSLATPVKFLIELLEKHRVKWQTNYSQ